MTMTRFDVLYIALVGALLLMEHLVLWPAFLRRSETDAAGARRLLWSGWIVSLWTQVAVGAALWMSHARAWEPLRFIVPQGWRLWSAIAAVLALVVANGRPILRIARNSSRKRIQLANPHVAKLTPHTNSELGLWLALSLSAGFCEEVVFRGYLIWVLQPVAGLWGAAALSLVAFALAHAYQGAKGVVWVAIVGGVFTLAVLVFGSLWPAIALHALVDIGQGLLGWVVFRRAPLAGAPVAGVTAA